MTNIKNVIGVKSGNKIHRSCAVAVWVHCRGFSEKKWGKNTLRFCIRNKII